MTHKSLLSHRTEAFATVVEYIYTVASSAIISLGIKNSNNQCYENAKSYKYGLTLSDWER